MRIIYVSQKGGKPMNLGMNKAKRLARRMDQRDQKDVQHVLGFGLRRQHGHHQALVKHRHAYYHAQHEEFVRGQARAA